MKSAGELARVAEAGQLHDGAEADGAEREHVAEGLGGQEQRADDAGRVGDPRALAQLELAPISMNIALDIDPELIQVLTAIAHHDAICSESPLAPHVRQRLKARAELRWVQAVARRDAIPLNGHEVVQGPRDEAPTASGEGSRSAGA